MAYLAKLFYMDNLGPGFVATTKPGPPSGKVWDIRTMGMGKDDDSTGTIAGIGSGLSHGLVIVNNAPHPTSKSWIVYGRWIMNPGQTLFVWTSGGFGVDCWFYCSGYEYS